VSLAWCDWLLLPVRFLPCFPRCLPACLPACRISHSSSGPCMSAVSQPCPARKCLPVLFSHSLPACSPPLCALLPCAAAGRGRIRQGTMLSRRRTVALARRGATRHPVALTIAGYAQMAPPSQARGKHPAGRAGEAGKPSLEPLAQCYQLSPAQKRPTPSEEERAGSLAWLRLHACAR
jgi:hypothetical protein